MSASDLKQGSKIAQIAFVVMLALGMTEFIVGSLTRTVSLLADPYEKAWKLHDW